MVSIMALNISKVPRWRSGLMRNTGGGSFAPAAVFQKDLLSCSLPEILLFSAFIRVQTLPRNHASFL